MDIPKLNKGFSVILCKATKGQVLSIEMRGTNEEGARCFYYFDNLDGAMVFIDSKVDAGKFEAILYDMNGEFVEVMRPESENIKELWDSKPSNFWQRLLNRFR